MKSKANRMETAGGVLEKKKGVPVSKDTDV